MHSVLTLRRTEKGGEGVEFDAILSIFFWILEKTNTGTFFNTKRVDMPNFSRFWATWKIATKCHIGPACTEPCSIFVSAGFVLSFRLIMPGLFSSEEAENERMHLMTALELKNPGIFFKGLIILSQGLYMYMVHCQCVVFPDAAWESCCNHRKSWFRRPCLQHECDPCSPSIQVDKVEYPDNI